MEIDHLVLHLHRDARLCRQALACALEQLPARSSSKGTVSGCVLLGRLARASLMTAVLILKVVLSKQTVGAKGLPRVSRRIEIELAPHKSCSASYLAEFFPPTSGSISRYV